jgi:DNA-binding XRE family transcriptional regulator
MSRLFNLALNVNEFAFKVNDYPLNRNRITIMAKENQSPLVPLMAIRGITQKDIALELGVSPHTISNWVTGKTEPHLTLKEWHKLAHLLGTTIDKLPLSFAPQPIEPVRRNG